MTYFKAIVLFTAVAIVSARPQGDYSSIGNQQGMPYNFEWTVLDAPSGNDFGHAENSDGNNVQGQYYVYLPDGRLQTVTYTANDQTGFVADVRYEGEAQFPTSSGGGGGFIGGVIGGVQLGVDTINPR